MNDLGKVLNESLVQLKISGCCGIRQNEADFARSGSASAAQAGDAMNTAAGYLHGEDHTHAAATAMKLHSASKLALEIFNQ